MLLQLATQICCGTSCLRGWCYGQEDVEKQWHIKDYFALRDKKCGGQQSYWNRHRQNIHLLVEVSKGYDVY